MSVNRRKFLKIAGLGTLVGLGCSSVLDVLKRIGKEESQYVFNKKVITAGRWGMVIDMSKFESEGAVQRVVRACHRTHNVPFIDNEKEEIKWIWKDTYGRAFPELEKKLLPRSVKHRPYLLLCNHCANPPCVRVCPTKATFKRPDGIVAMDYHRCIGCRFCMAGCPYGSRSFNFMDPRPYVTEENPEYPTRTKGVVEKCDFCAERLEVGLKPVCVEESNGAILFGDMEDPNSEVRKALDTVYTLQRKPELGTNPGVFYVIGGGSHA
jgi:Fe-S-cluster-containing dehydrogenase component